MRNPLGDGADQRRTRRRGKNADQSDRGDSGPADAGRTGSRSDRGRTSHDSEPGRAGSDSEPGRAGEPRRTGRADGGRGGGNDATDRGVTGGPGNRAGRVPSAGSLFAPGYGASPPESPDRGAAGGRTTGASAWYGSAAGGAAGRGPVRGYAPVPGQPPPMYPPGQFAAWNRGPGRAAAQSGPNGPGSRLPGLPGNGRAAQDSRTAAGGAASNPGFLPSAWPPGAADSELAKSRYYPQDLGSGAEPGYSMLAVSDPAADMTSTQTWQAVGDGRATGMWTAPARPGSSPPGDTRRDSRGPAISDPGSTPDQEQAEAGSGRRGLADLGDPTGVLGGAAGDARDTASRPRIAASHAGVASDQAGTEAADTGHRGGRGHSGAHTSPRQLPRSQRRVEQPARPDEPQRRSGTKPRRKHPASVKVAMATALVLVLVAAAALSYAALRSSGRTAAAGAGGSKSTVKPSLSTSPSPSLGPYGHIASRQADPAPLTMAALYPTTFTSSGTTVVRTAASRNPNCAANLVGSGIQSAIGSAGCSQVIRATYLASSPGLMGTIGVLNLSTASAATTAARSADASDFISQLTAASGPTSKIGQGTGIEEAAAKGHYLILIWAEFTSLRKPRTAAQRTTIEQFMTELLENTANVSLTNRMLTGTP